MEKSIFVYQLCALLSLISNVVCQQSITSSTDVTVGLSVTLTCTANSAAAASRVTWWSPRGELLTMDYSTQTTDNRFSVPRGYQRERNLHISNVRMSDAGVYECKTSSTEIFASVNLVINVPPSLRFVTPYLKPVVGNDATLFCNATGIPAPEVTWYRVHGESETALSRGSILDLSPASRDDAGVYKCRADNRVPPAADRPVRIDVQFGPVLSLPYRKMMQSLNTDALLTCLVHAYPPPELHWYHGEQAGRSRLPTTSSDKYRVQNWTVDEYSLLFGLHITKIKQSDYGDYFCEAHNDYGTGQAQLIIYAFNDSQATLPVVGCASSSNSALIAVIVVIVIALAVTMAALFGAVYKIRRLQQASQLGNEDCKTTADIASTSQPVASAVTSATDDQKLQQISAVPSVSHKTSSDSSHLHSNASIRGTKL